MSILLLKQQIKETFIHVALHTIKEFNVNIYIHTLSSNGMITCIAIVVIII